MLYSPPFYI